MATTEYARPEANRICNLIPSRDTERDWRIESAIESKAIAAPAAALPSCVDLRAAWWNIGNQESTGSCVGWASTDGVARYHMVRAGKLPETGRLSPRCTWMASKETDEFTNRPETFIEGAGTSLKAAMEFLRKYGSVLESFLPFPHLDQHVFGQREHILRRCGDAPYRFLFQPGQGFQRVAHLACHTWPDHGWIERGRNLG